MIDETDTVGTGSKSFDVEQTPAGERFCRNIKYVGIVMFSILSVVFAIVLTNATIKLMAYFL